MLFNYLRTDRDGQMAMHWEKKYIAPAMNTKINIFSDLYN